MSGTFTSQSLAAGYLSNTVSILYQAPSSNVGYVKNFQVTNNTSNSVLVSLFKNISGNLYPWIPAIVLNGGEWADVLENETITLSSGDSIQANTNVSTANAVSYTVHGVQEK